MANWQVGLRDRKMTAQMRAAGKLLQYVDVENLDSRARN